MKPCSALPSCTLLGILDDGWGGLSELARQRLTAADLVIAPVSATRRDDRPRRRYCLTSILRACESFDLGSVIVSTPSLYSAATSSSITGQGSVNDREKQPIRRSAR